MSDAQKVPETSKMSETQKTEETLGQEDQSVAGEGEGTSLVTPLKVVQTFLSTVKTKTNCPELADKYILSFFKRTYVPLMSGKNVPAHFLHEGFKEADFVSPTQAGAIKLRLTRNWMKQHRIRRREARRLRAESDDEERPPAPPAVQPSPKPKLDFDRVTFVESLGVLKRMHNSPRGWTVGEPMEVKLTLGYRLLPLSFDSGQGFEIRLAIYDMECPGPVLPINADSTDSSDTSDSSESSNSSDSYDSTDTSESFDSSDSSDSDEMPPPAARKRQYTNNAAEVEPKRQPKPF